MSTARYTFIQLCELGEGVVERMEMTKLQNNSRVYSYPGSLDGESGVLSLSYHAPHDVIETRNIWIKE